MSDRRKRSQISDHFTALVQEAADRSHELKKEVLVSITEEYAQVDPLRLFSNTEEFASDRWYWERPSEDFAVASAGVLVGSTPPRNIRYDEANWILQNTLTNAIIDTPRGAECPGALFFAAFSFDPERRQDRTVWQGFPSTYLLLPRATLARHGSQHFITFNILVSRNLDLAALKESTFEFRERVLQSLSSSYPDTAGTVDLDPDGTNERNADSFMDDVTVAESAIRAGVLEKVVLARRRTIATDGTLVAWHAAKLGGPEYDRIVEHATLL
jgi:menaquinone-specific isochorismate synthase